MRYDRGDSFTFDFESYGNPFGSKSKGILSPRSYPIQYERKYCFLISLIGKLCQREKRDAIPIFLSRYSQINRYLNQNRMKRNLDCNYTFPINYNPNLVQFNHIQWSILSVGNFGYSDTPILHRYSDSIWASKVWICVPFRIKRKQIKFTMLI